MVRATAFALALLVPGALALARLPSPPRELAQVSLTYPAGELFLHVERNAGARLSYGALPGHQTVEKGTFDLDELYERLLPRLHEVVPGDQMPAGTPYGMVQLSFRDKRTKAYLLYDGAFARELFRVACENRVDHDDTATEELNASATEIIANECLLVSERGSQILDDLRVHRE